MLSNYFNDWMQRYASYTPKILPKWDFSHIVIPKISLKNLALSLLYPYGGLNTSKRLRKKI